MASYGDDAYSRTCFCLNQDPIYLFTVLNLNHCSLYNTLKFSEVCADARIFPCFFFLVLFMIRFIFRFLQSPFPVACYYHLFMLMLSLAACIITPPFIFPSCVIYSTHQLPILRSLFAFSACKMTLLSLSHVSQSAQIILHPSLFFLSFLVLCCLLPLAIHFSPTRLLLMLTQLDQVFASTLSVVFIAWAVHY